MQTQNFKNHSRIVPGFHYVILGMLVVVLVIAVINLIYCSTLELHAAGAILLLTVAAILMAFYSRGFALKAQDRAIRAEENFRHFLATGQPLDNRLTMQQIIALRFAGDDEFVPMAKRAIAENMTSKEIKTAIQHWKGDYNRV